MSADFRPLHSHKHYRTRRDRNHSTTLWSGFFAGAIIGAFTSLVFWFFITSAQVAGLQQVVGTLGASEVVGLVSGAVAGVILTIIVLPDNG